MGLEKVRLSSWEALVRLVSGSPCGTVSVDERRFGKRRLSGRECSRRRPSEYRRDPTGGPGSLCRTGKDGKVSRPWGGKGKVVWPGGSRRRLTGD